MHKSLFVFLLLTAVTLWNCANQTTPTGGPKDETPPNLIKSRPAHKEKNYKDKTVTLEFDEFINLNNPKEEVLISPSIGRNVQFKVKKRTVTIVAEDGWQDSTTYTIATREGIRDITENNAPDNFQLAFSTGPTIDSLSIQGKVKFSIKEEVPDKITVAIYQPDTFDIFKHSPSYFTMANKSGKFSLENIKDGNYAIYAFHDKNKNLKVESRTEAFGFLRDTIRLATLSDSLLISLVNIDTREPKVTSIRNTDKVTRIKFNKAVDNYTLTHDRLHRVIHTYGDDQSEVSIYLPEALQDSIPIRIYATDSLTLHIDTMFYIKKITGNFIADDFTLKPEKIKYSLETQQLSLKIKTSKPLLSINYDSIFIKNDSARTVFFEPHNFQFDTTNKTLIITKVIPFDSLFINRKFNPEYNMAKGALVSVHQDSSKANHQSLLAVTPEQTGTLLIQTETTAPHFIIQLYSSSNELIQEIINKKEHTFRFLAPQNYKLRMIKDRNHNGKWDAGNIFNREEPEETFFYKTPEGSSTIPIRANWELGPLLLIF